ncbi:site-specific integrase [Kitasatospora sp. NPDC048538]|uniref:site-specific integrase n=1 Tax=unclassified Kitasatospora TaxID=2633591 RepID=UPI0033C02695
MVITEGVSSGWRVCFADPGRRWPQFSDPVAVKFVARLPELQRAHGRRPGQPFLLGPGGRPDGRVNAFFTTYPMTSRDPDTWRKYAYALGLWLNFLAARGQGWQQAVAADVEAFKFWRMADPANPQRVAAGTLKGDLVAVNVFYGWAARHHAVVSPVEMREVRAPAPRGSVEEIVAGPVGIRSRDVKWFTPAGYRRWRDIGLRGLGLDGLEDPRWRGRGEQRDGAFADGLFETGLRLSEWASVLDIELPGDDPDRAFTTRWLADACAKGGLGRRYWLPRSALLGVLSYSEGARARAVRRAQRQDRYAAVPGRVVVERVHANRRLTVRDACGTVSSVSLDTLDPQARQNLFREGEAGLEPLAVWLNEDGLPRDPHGWQHTFTTANARIAALGLDGFSCSAHRLRHSFALRWYSVGKLLYDARFAHLDREELRDFRVQFGDTWQLVQTMLGHRSVTTTMDVYLEPFRHLDVELLLEQTVGVPVAALLDQVWHQHPKVAADPLADRTGPGFAEMLR